MQIGLVGFPGAGRSTLFQALTGLAPAPPSGNPMTHQSIGIVKIPDPRMEWLRAHFQPKKYTPATVEFIDFAGIPQSDERGKGELFHRVRNADVLLLVVSAFDGAADAETVPGEPALRVKALLDEFLLADLEIVERRVERLEEALKKGATKTRDRDERELDLMRRLQRAMEASEPLGDVARTDDEQAVMTAFGFAVSKPRLVVVNTADDADCVALAGAVEKATGETARAVRGQVEAEIAMMPEADRPEFLAEYGLERPAVEEVVRAAFSRTRNIPFFTVGEDEVRAWLIREGDSALVAAGRIHSDIARGFIRAEVTPFEDLKRAGSIKDAKALNLPRLEGKDYVVKDGDIVHFRFSV